MTIKDSLRRPYRLRMAVPKAKSIEVTFPYEVVEREARKNGLSVAEFIKTHQAVAHYNNFDGVVYRFEEIPKETEEIHEIAQDL